MWGNSVDFARFPPIIKGVSTIAHLETFWNCPTLCIDITGLSSIKKLSKGAVWFKEF